MEITELDKKRCKLVEELKKKKVSSTYSYSERGYGFDNLKPLDLKKNDFQDTDLKTRGKEEWEEMWYNLGYERSAKEEKIALANEKWETVYIDVDTFLLIAELIKVDREEKSSID